MQLALDNIQGNILGGFNKDFQDFVFLRFRDQSAARAWVADIAADEDFGVAGSSSEAVLGFNARFKALKADGKKPEDFIEATWTNLAISYKGLQALGVPPEQLDGFDEPFKEGMAARADVIGDRGESAPTNWEAPFANGDIHALLQVGADSEAGLAWRLGNIRSGPWFQAGVETVGDVIEGRTRMDMPHAPHPQVGHEHFGFKDGVSQPGVRGIDLPDDPIGNPDQGHPGQDLLWPGEFVLGYPAQNKNVPTDGHQPNRAPGEISGAAIPWAKDGSYLVFRRLQQDVPGFQAQIASTAAARGISTDLMGAVLVGRYASGCPLEKRTSQTPPFPQYPTDPEWVRPGVADSDALNNDFEFGNDADGAICPMASHIRKAYPRDEDTDEDPGNSESATQKHRLMRRGIPFGGSFGAHVNGGAADKRGLLFQCYQRSIEDQFEFVQGSWVNNVEFPPGKNGTSGEDPIIAQSEQGPFEIEPGKPITVKHFVKTTGGEYFFAPSIASLKRLGAGSL